MAEHALRVGIDGFNLERGHGTGVATYARNLARAVRAIGGSVELVFGLPVPAGASEATREVAFFEGLGRQEAMISATAPRRRRWWVSPRPRRLARLSVSGVVHDAAFADRLPPFDALHSFGSLWSVAARHFRLFGRFLEVVVDDPPAIMHWTYPLPLRLRGAANVYTIHDLVPLRLPHTSLEDKPRHERLVRRCVAESVRICTVSETSRNDIVAMLGADAARVVNCYQAIDPVPPVADEVLTRQLAGWFGLGPHGYLLFFGAIEPKKNLARLTEAYLASGVATPLVVVGAPGWMAEPELRLIETRAREGWGGATPIRVLPYLPRRMLDALVAGARAVLFPALYEGFGLPVVEAMARGVPVLASTTGALPEITGGASLLVDPYDPAAIGAGIAQLDRDAALRTRLSHAGRERARRFAPDQFEAALAAFYAPLSPHPATA